MQSIKENSRYDDYLKKRRYFYDCKLDENINYEDISSIILGMPKNIIYGELSLANYDEEPYGYMYCFNSLEDFEAYYETHPEMENLEKFSFSITIANIKLSFCFEIDTNELSVNTGYNEYDFTNLIVGIEQSIKENKKKQL